MNTYTAVVSIHPEKHLAEAAFYLHSSLTPGSIRLTPASIEHLCTQYQQIVLLMPATTNDAFQQGSQNSREAFLLELFQQFADIHRTTLKISKDRNAPSVAADGCVTSVQTWYEKHGADVNTIAESYFWFLPAWTKKWVRVKRDMNQMTISAAGLPLLQLQKEKKQLPTTISSWKITGGLLTSKRKPAVGRLWFMKSKLRSGLCYAALTHYEPSVPAVFYKWTQAPLHKLVMHQFALYRYRLSRRSRQS
ncbi:hypothetical protein [Alkalicoccus chagannorensis]|uniref:hypothetical protein n=1 Tax=Alkalicoccus chagannorensis TaxID=427072 RepID=UPI00041394F7|nr:hypothetical protein [Alkalicoccus chagannorensis]